MNALPLVAIGRTFFAIALIGLGIEHIVFQQFVVGRAPAWPEGVGGKQLWMTASGALVILAGMSIVAQRWARQALLVLALLVLTWALLRHLPVVAGDASLGGSWTRLGKALTFVGGSLAVAGTLPPAAGLSRYVNATALLVRLGAICLGMFVVVSGLQHFKFTPFVITLIPPWFPGDHTWWARFAGVALITGGLGLLIRRTMKPAALLTGLMLFSWVWIVHLPRTFVSVSDAIALFEALAFSGMALLISGADQRRGVRSPD